MSIKTYMIQVLENNTIIESILGRIFDRTPMVLIIIGSLLIVYAVIRNKQGDKMFQTLITGLTGIGLIIFAIFLGNIERISMGSFAF